MDEDEVLRIEVRLLKSFYGINYKTIADDIGIKQRSFYNWLAGQWDLSSSRKRRLHNYIKRKKEE